jgi:hypothetical protein
MKYTIKDLKEGKVILMNSNEVRCKKILKLLGITMESYELPGMTYYHWNPIYTDGLNSFDIIERDAPKFKHLPIQSSQKFSFK